MKKRKKTILVVLGGTSRERDISLETGKACIKSIKRLGYNVKVFDPAKKFFNEIKRIIKVGGRLEISTPDFEMTVKQWLAAKDDWKDFFRDDDEAIKQNHWFGNYNNKPNNRWGYLLATIFGSQNGEGQFHKNCYTEKKLIAICKKIGIKIINIERFQWKEDRDHMLKMIATK